LHCMDCGEKCECVNYVENSTKYYCKKCDSFWFRTSRVVVEYTKQKTQIATYRKDEM
jgi:hypothetical protein